MPPDGRCAAGSAENSPLPETPRLPVASCPRRNKTRLHSVTLRLNAGKAPYILVYLTATDACSIRWLIIRSASLVAGLR